MQENPNINRDKDVNLQRLHQDYSLTQMSQTHGCICTRAHKDTHVSAHAHTHILQHTKFTGCWLT